MSDFVGIARERIFSPGKVEADRAILDAVAGRLRSRGHAVRVVSGEDAPPSPRTGTTVFAMCQGDEALARLRAWQERGSAVVNRVESILLCHRHRQLERLARSGVRIPETVLLASVVEPPAAWPAWLEDDGGWLKRGDVHAIAGDDVAFVRGARAAREHLRAFGARGIERAVLQRHVAGTVLKFYGVGDDFFAWFPPAGTALHLEPDKLAELHELARAGARALALDVFGGDCVADDAGSFQLIDVNDWPSFAPCRAEAAAAIALHLEAVAR